MLKKQKIKKVYKIQMKNNTNIISRIIRRRNTSNDLDSIV